MHHPNKHTYGSISYKSAAGRFRLRQIIYIRINYPAYAAENSFAKSSSLVAPAVGLLCR